MFADDIIICCESGEQVEEVEVCFRERKSVHQG